MSCKLKNIVVFLRVLSNFIVLRNFGKIHKYVCMYIEIFMYRYGPLYMLLYVSILLYSISRLFLALLTLFASQFASIFQHAESKFFFYIYLVINL